MENFFAGGLSGLIGYTLTWPIEFSKIIKQLPKYKQNTFIESLKNEFRVKGINTFTRGLSSQLLFSFPRTALRFSIYEKLNNSSDNILSPKLTKFINGLFAGFIEGVTLMVPGEIIKVQMINKNINLTNSFKFIYYKYGINGFYKGSLPSVIRLSSTQGVTFLTYDYSINYFNKSYYFKNNSALYAGIAGGVASVFINNPIDVIKTYKQSDRINSNTLSITNEIFKSKGIFGFYNGLIFRTARVAPLQGITLYTYNILSK